MNWLPSRSWYRWLVLLILLALSTELVAGCVPTSPLPGEQDTSILDPNACQPPCWHGIAPGQTGFDEAMQILGGLSFVARDSVQVGHDIQPGYDATIFWRYRGANQETPAGRIASKAGVVSFVRVPFAQPLALGQILAIQGDPDLVAIGLRPDGLHNVTMFYQKRGLWLDGTQAYQGKADQWRAVMSGDMRIDEVEYFAPSDLVTYLVRDAGMKDEDARSFAAGFKAWPGLNQTVQFTPAP